MSNSSYSIDIDGDSQGFHGHNDGGTVVVNVNKYISSLDPNVIHERILIEGSPGSPYLELKKFRDIDKDKFFGREQLIADFSKYLEEYNSLLLIGASGIGKSSLVQAGLIPSLFNKLGASKLEKLIFVPHKNPFESLHKSVPNECNDIATKINPENNDGLIKFIDNLKEYSPKWIIFIDQFEEIFTRTPELQRNQFIANLVSLIKKSDSSVKLIIAMRYDFIVNIEQSQYSDFNNQLNLNKIVSVGQMSESELRLAIAEPAARIGVTFEKDLVEKIIRNFKKQAGSLPLLQYTLNLLWEKANISDENRVLMTANYDDLGGVSGALEKQANYIYNQKLKSDEEKKAAKQIFIELINLVDKEPVSRRIEKSELINQDNIRESALNTLIDHRLLVSGRYESTTVEVAHEELLRSWGILKTLIEEKRELIIIRSRLSSDADQWYERRKQDEEQAKDELWSGYKLEQVQELNKKKAFGRLDKKSKQFIQASVNWRESQKREKQEQRKREELNLVDSLGYSSLFLFKQGNELDAFVEAIKAGKTLQKHKETAPTVINALQEILYEKSERNRLIGHKGKINSVAFSSDHDNQILASASDDGTVKLWNFEGKELQTLSGHQSKVRTVAFSPDNQILASAGDDGTIKLWKWNNSTGQFETPPDDQILRGHKGSVNSVAFSPDGQILASAGDDGTIKLWNLEGRELQAPLDHNSKVRTVAFSHDNQILASAGECGTIKLWQWNNSTAQFEAPPDDQILRGHKGSVNSVAFSPNNQILASAGWDGTVFLWKRNSTGQFETPPNQTLEGCVGVVNSVAFRPDGKTIATANEYRTINIWKRNNSTGQVKFKLDQTLEGSIGWVNSVTFSPDGKILASASLDETAKLWNLKENDGLQTPLTHEPYVWSVAFSPNGKTIATANQNTSIKLWNR